MTPRGLLERLTDFERRVLRAYLSLGDRATFPAEIRFFWNCMADDERRHLAILERSVGLLDLMDTPPSISPPTLVAIETKVLAVEAAMTRVDLTNDEALQQALILEVSKLNNLDDDWISSFRPALGALLQAMMPEEEAHIRRLVKAVQAFSVDAALQQQAAALWSSYQHQHRHAAQTIDTRATRTGVASSAGGQTRDDGFRFADSLGPHKIVHLHDAAVGLRAVVVVDNVACGPAIGGIRMAHDVTTEEAFRLARAMTFKNAAAGLPHGGGKSVIVGDPKMPLAQKEHVIRAFACAIRDLTGYIPGPDMGTDERCMGWIKDEIGRAVGLLPAIGGIPLDEIGATGLGVSACIAVAARYCNVNIRGSRVVIQGFGAVGKLAARFLSAQGAVLIGVADSQGTLSNSKGIDVTRLIALKNAGHSVLDYNDGEKLANDAVLDLECEVWIPPARPDVIRQDNIARLKTKLIEPGANIAVTAEAEQLLHDRDVLVLPDFIAKTGGVICAAVEYHGGTQALAFQTIEEKIRTNTTLVLEEARTSGIPPRQAAVAFAERRIRDAMTYRRWSARGGDSRHG